MSNNHSHSHLPTQNSEDLPKQGGGGFSTVQAFALPPETWYLVKANLNKSEMRVTLCILLNYFQVGIDAEPLTFGEVVKQTGLSKSIVSSALEKAIQRGSINRTTWNNQPRYEPRFEKNRTHDMAWSPKETLKSEPSQDKYKPCHETEIEPRQEIFQKLLKFGLAYHVAQNISLTDRYPLARITNQISYIEYEQEHDLVPVRSSAFPGYVVNRIKYDRQPLQGYGDNGAWYTPDEFENIIES